MYRIEDPKAKLDAGSAPCPSPSPDEQILVGSTMFGLSEVW